MNKVRNSMGRGNMAFAFMFLTFLNKVYRIETCINQWLLSKHLQLSLGRRTRHGQDIYSSELLLGLAQGFFDVDSPATAPRMAQAELFATQNSVPMPVSFLGHRSILDLNRALLKGLPLMG